MIPGVTAGEGIGLGADAGYSRAAIAPGNRPAIAVPAITSDHVVAVAQGRDAGIAHNIPGIAADEAIGFRDDAAGSGAAVPPSHRTTLVVPEVAYHYVVTVAQRGDTAAHIIPEVAACLGVAAYEAIGFGDGAGCSSTAVAPGPGSAITI